MGCWLLGGVGGGGAFGITCYCARHQFLLLLALGALLYPIYIPHIYTPFDLAIARKFQRFFFIFYLFLPRQTPTYSPFCLFFFSFFQLRGSEIMNESKSVKKNKESGIKKIKGI